MPITLHSTEVLILGSGLSGLRAALAAKGKNPKLDVTVACMRKGPSGSSFTNRNNNLGYQLLDTDDRKNAFVEEAMALGWPGFINQNLVETLARESESCFREMEEIGLCFRRDKEGNLVRYPGCGSPDPRAVLFDDLNASFNRYIKKTIDYRCKLITDFEVLGLAVKDGLGCGAWGLEPLTGLPAAIRAKTVIVALGGPAPLFLANIAGSANPGLGYGLLEEVGAELANTSFLQFMWGERDGSFRNPSALLAPGNKILNENGTTLSQAEIFGAALDELRRTRSTHCPSYHCRPDTQLDQLLKENCWSDGFARIRTRNKIIEAGLFAHAGNGGAVVDENGESSIPNLFAVGECATGMHGANRIGGAMILATQVFGRKAGKQAAKRATNTPLIARKDFAGICKDLPEIARRANTEKKTVRDILAGMQRYALSGRKPEIQKLRKWLEGKGRSKDRKVQLTALSALKATEPDQK